MGDVIIKKAASKRELAQCVQIRTLVFVVGQNVPAEREVDEHEDTCTYWIALVDNQPIGTVRWRKAAKNLAKIERLAVLDAARGQRIGEKLTQAVLDDIRQDPAIASIKLGAQDYIMPLYRKFGFEPVGEGYLDGGTIPHHDMVMHLRPA